MNKKDVEFGRRVPLQEDVPDHSKNCKKVWRPLGNLSIEDFAWLGVDGNLNPDPIVMEMTSPPVLLRAIAQAIVYGNPSSDKSSKGRVETAMSALLGTGTRKGRRYLSSDERILRRMAIEYLEGFHGFKNPHPSLNSLSNSALQAEPGFAEKGEEWKESRRRTIARKFERFQDRLLTEVSLRNNWDVQKLFAEVRAILKSLHDLGIHLPPERDWPKCPEMNP